MGKKTKRRVQVFAAGGLVLVGLAGVAWAGSKVTLGKKYSPGQLVPLCDVDHRPWDHLLHKYVDTDGMVDYAAWHRARADVAALDRYLEGLSRADLRADPTRDEKLAFWINAYNAVTVRGILREYPTSSIRNHTARVLGYNIWNDLLLLVGEESYSLGAMEHEILRKMGEPRIHFAIVCASIGCPRLRNEAYVPDRLEAQLADNTRDFFSRRKSFHVDHSSRTVYTSAILEWFGEDFGRTPQEGLASLAEHLPDDASRRLVGSGQFTVRYLDYDWGLNEKRQGK